MKRVDEHLSEFEMWLLAEGELSARRSAPLHRHIDHCWKCKTELAALQETVMAFMEYRRSCVIPAQPPWPPSTARFERRLLALEDQLRNEKTSNLFGQRPFTAGWLPKFVACATTLAFIFFVSQTIQAPIVSANEIMQRSIVAEQSPIPVHQQISIRQSSHTENREVWRDRGAHVVNASASSPSALSEVDKSLVRIGWSITDPLSAHAFAHWRDSLTAKKDVVRNTSDFLYLSTSTGEGEIESAELTVRKSDFHPLAEVLQLRHAAAINLQEVAFHQNVALPKESAPAAPAPLVSMAQAHKRITAAPLPAMQIPDQNEVEANARVALHRLNEDLGQPIVVKRDANNQVVIEAIEAEPSELDRIKQEIPNVPIVTVASEAPGMSQTPASAVTIGSGGSLHGISILEQQFPDPQSRTDFSNAVLETSHLALLRSYALRNLATRYPQADWLKLTPASQQELNAVHRDHLAALRQMAGHLQNQLAPLFAGQAELPTVEEPQSVEAALAQMQEVDLSINILFAGARTTSSVDDTLSRLRRSLSSAVSVLNALPETIHP